MTDVVRSVGPGRCGRINHGILVERHGVCRFCEAISDEEHEARRLATQTAEDERATEREARLEAAAEHRDTNVEVAASQDTIWSGPDGRTSIGATLDLIIDRYLRTHPTLHIDDLWDYADTQPEWKALGLAPDKYVGAPMKRAIKAGKMSQVTVLPTLGDGVPSYAARPSVRSALSPKWCYRSNLFDKQEET